ncbi:hypothetical protein [Kangiella sp.]|uniref:hypothetical protein n=1 Tax=Kangiella sp. TaxID=1920245 RepID=UPI0019AC7343|nr:hypothetical protein [Kangiella sp.]MBD3653149.1 hypothetical protein [Kangiella sp.]
MKVNIKNLNVSMEVKNSGIEFSVYDSSDKFLGDMFVTKSGLTWCKGRTSKQNGKRITWNKFIELMDEK